jgi:hypothetical protein
MGALWLSCQDLHREEVRMRQSFSLEEDAYQPYRPIAFLIEETK